MYTYHGLITDRLGDALELEADHRRHAVVEHTIRDLKYGVGLNHMPSGRFGANAAWLGLNVLAYNLGRWLGRLGLPGQSLDLKALRHRFISLPGRIVSSGRRLRLRLPCNWPWQDKFEEALGRLRQLASPVPMLA